MKLQKIALAAVAALSVSAAHAIPAFSTDLGTDPMGAPFIGTALLPSLIPGGLTSEFTFDLVGFTGITGSLFGVGTAPITISSISLVGGSLSSAVTALNPNSGTFSFAGLTAGSYTLAITATTTAFPSANYIGSLTAVTPVPEAQTYALALAGLGVVGLMAARRKKV